jgi:hypothetical protein
MLSIAPPPTIYLHAGATDMRAQAAAVEAAVTALTGTLAEVVRTAAPETDRREAPRIAPPFPVSGQLALERGGVGHKVEVRNLSTGGVGLACGQPVPAGSTAWLTVPAVGLDTAVAVRVVDAVQGRDGAELHLAFTNLPPASAASLQAWLAAHGKAA